MNLPEGIADLLWSYDATKVDPGRDASTIILAVLRLGEFDQIRWLFSQYGWEKVKDVIAKDYFGVRSLPVSVRAFWGNLFWPDDPPPELADDAERWRQTRITLDEQASLTVRQRLRNALSRSGLTQEAFAKLLGTSQSRLSSYLSGKVQPSAVFVEKAELLADLLTEALESRQCPY